MKYRLEKDTLGIVEVPKDALWGPQTQRSINNFKIGPPASMPIEIIYGFAIVKKAAAYANHQLSVLSEFKRDLIVQVCDEILHGTLDTHFPLVIWQTGSGTQTNMNVNEVIANKAQINQNKEIGGDPPVLKPNDDVNKSQSSNDTFPTAMHIATYQKIHHHTIVQIERLTDIFKTKAKQFEKIVKIGRTHMMDATPLTLGQEFSGYFHQLKTGLETLEQSMNHLSELAIGGTAVGTGLNTPNGYDELVVKFISDFTQLPFKTATNKFEALSSHDAIIGTHNALKKLAVSLNKIGNDIRMLASGPRSGLGELSLPSNEPGSSIMPGKVNPTQCEALTMVCSQIIGNDVALSVGGTQGHFQLNVFKPMIAYNILQSAILLGDVCKSFGENCVAGIEARIERIEELVDNSLMLVTALNPKIGYYKAAEIAQKAYTENTTLKQACLALGYLTSEEFDSIVHVEKMTRPNQS